MRAMHVNLISVFLELYVVGSTHVSTNVVRAGTGVGVFILCRATFESSSFIRQNVTLSFRGKV